MAASADPLILSCGGASTEAARAAAVADELAAAGLGVRAVRPLSGAQLIAVDGCAGACCSRRLESAGLRAAVVVDAAAARTTAAAVATTRSQFEQRRPHRHRVRQCAPSPVPTAHGPHSVRDYLLALDELTAPLVNCGVIAPGLPALASHVSRLLGVSRAAAGEMLDRLEKAGLVARTAGRQVVLTEAGRAAGDAAVRRHRILEVFAVTQLGYATADSFGVARGFDVAFDDDAIERLAAALGSPTRCPHGWPTAPHEAQTAAAGLRTLDTAKGEQPAVVVALSERPTEALRELAAYGIEPGVRADICRDRLSMAARQAVFVSAHPR